MHFPSELISKLVQPLFPSSLLSPSHRQNRKGRAKSFEKGSGAAGEPAQVWAMRGHEQPHLLERCLGLAQSQDQVHFQVDLRECTLVIVEDWERDLKDIFRPTRDSFVWPSIRTEDFPSTPRPRSGCTSTRGGTRCHLTSLPWPMELTRACWPVSGCWCIYWQLELGSIWKWCRIFLALKTIIRRVAGGGKGVERRLRVRKQPNEKKSATGKLSIWCDVKFKFLSFFFHREQESIHLDHVS